MSFILDALNKAQRERQEQHQPVPQLSTVHHTPPAPMVAMEGRRPSLVVMFAGLAILAVIAVGLGYWLMADRTPSAKPVEDAAAVIVAPAPQVPASPAKPEPGPAEPQVESGRAESNGAQNAAPMPEVAPSTPAAEVATLYQSARETPASAQVSAFSNPTSTPAPVEAVTHDNPAAAVDAEEPDPAAQAAAALAQIRARQRARPVPVSQLVKPQPQEVQGPSQVQMQAPPQTQAPLQTETPEHEPASQNSVASRIDIPFVQELSWTLQQTLPTINYSAHNYSAASGESSVDINGTTYRTGSQIGGGLAVEEILSDGVILRFRGQAVKLRALNSWVNF